MIFRYQKFKLPVSEINFSWYQKIIFWYAEIQRSLFWIIDEPGEHVSDL